MHVWDAAILGCVQGITEFLPVSSTAHASVYKKLLSLYPFGKNFDIILNLGTLLSILIYFHKDIAKLFLGGLDFLCNEKTKNRHFFLVIFLADLPTIAVFGILELLGFEVNSLLLTAINLVVFGIVLYLCDLRRETSAGGISMRDGIKIGIVQLLSILPGVSRLGICLSMCRYLRYNRGESFKFSILLSIPPMTGAIFLKVLKMIHNIEISYCFSDILSGTISAFVFGIISLHLIFNFLKTHTLFPIIIYRIGFGLFLIFLYFFG